MKPSILAVLLLAPPAALHADNTAKTIRLDPASPGRVFEGIDAVSAGGSTSWNARVPVARARWTFRRFQEDPAAHFP